MLKRNIFIIAIFCTILLGKTYASRQEGTQVWTSASAGFKITDSWNINVAEEMRYKESDLSYYHTDIGFSSKTLIEGAKVGLNYRLFRYKNSKDRWIRAAAPHLNFTLYDTILKLPVSNRFRFQFRDNENTPDMWIFRNKTTIKLFSIGKVKPYVADEFFIKMADDTQIDRNRLSFGASFKLNKQAEAKLFYLIQTTKSTNKWSNLDVLGFSLKITF